MRIGRFMAVAAAAVTLAAGCGNDDDGAGVREIGGSDSGSASGSASASGSGSASASAPASGSGVAGGCEIEGGASGESDTEVHGRLSEYAIDLDIDTVSAGLVELEFENLGAEPHEVAIVRGDDPATLPTTEDGAVDDEAVGDDLVGEIEPFASGETCAGTFDLSPGTYLLVCNIVEEDEHEAHFAEGMVTTLTVTG